MKPDKIFKRYDVRGKFPEELDSQFAYQLGRSIATLNDKENFGNSIVVGKDNKESSEELKNNLISGLKDSGIKVIDVGTGTTDYTAFCGVEECCVSIQVTSSHMPLNFNGFKFMYPKGNGFVNEDLNKIEDIFRSKEFIDGEGFSEDKEDFYHDMYKERVLEFLEKFELDFEEKIIVDTLGGSSEKFVFDLLDSLEVDFVDLGEDKDGIYVDPPNPTEENLESLKEEVESSECSLGISFDLDADRVSVYFDENGFLSGQEVFGLLAKLTKSGENVVGSIDTSGMVEDVVGEDNMYYTRVGDPFVMEEALDVDAVLAGEPNGHYSFLDFVPYNSGILAGLILAGLDVGKGLDSLPDYYVGRESFRVEDKVSSMNRILEGVRDDESLEIISEKDGVKFVWNDVSVLVRSSGSSHKIRVVADSEREFSMEDLVSKIKSFLEPEMIK